MIFGISFHLKELLFYIGGIALYSSAGYFILPDPDYTNVGWLGGLIDNPFRVSDDLNRMLLFIMILLMPGRLIATTFVSWIDFFKKND